MLRLKKHKYSYSSVDFIINGYIKIQDKTAKKIFSIRRESALPYNPDDIDIFQVSDLVNNIVYAIPMRVLKNKVIDSFFTTEQLMKRNITFSNKWKEDHKQFKHDFKTIEGKYSYIKACEIAATIPELTDREFYKNMILMLIKKNLDL